MISGRFDNWFKSLLFPQSIRLKVIRQAILKVRSDDTIFHQIFSLDSLLTYKIVPCYQHGVESWKQSLKYVENLKCVRFSINSLVKIVTSQWLYPIQQKYWIGFINRKSIVKSYRWTTSTILTPINLPEQVNLNSDAKPHCLTAPLQI